METEPKDYVMVAETGYFTVTEPPTNPPHKPEPDSERVESSDGSVQ
jgi:hypothetical protein